MKVKSLKIILLLISFLYNGQVFKLHYDYIVRNDFINRDFIFPAEVMVNAKEKNKLYTVQFGIEKSNSIKNNFFVSNKKPRYLLYTNNNEVLISDYIPNAKEQNYFFKDSYKMDWQLAKETKIEGKILLSKAETIFRGRKYICWYDAKKQIKEGPWKFTNVPGLIHEIADETKYFEWKLKKIEILQQEITNPFAEIKEPPFSYRQYPDLRYGVSEDLKQKLSKNPNNYLITEKRDGLEIEFEWE